MAPHNMRHRCGTAAFDFAALRDRPGVPGSSPPPTGAFVVEDVARREFAQHEEARAGDELALVARHPRSYRQRWEVVARQESFAREISVGIKVTFLAGGVNLKQQ